MTDGAKVILTLAGIVASSSGISPVVTLNPPANVRPRVTLAVLFEESHREKTIGPVTVTESKSWFCIVKVEEELVRFLVIVLFPDGNWNERPALLVELLPTR